MKRLTPLVLALLAIPATALAAGALKGDTHLRSTPAANTIYGAGQVEGSARLINDASTGRTAIVTRVERLKPGSKHAGHIHFGDCSRLFPGAIIHDLEPLIANAHGNAVSRTVIDDSLAGLKDGEWWIAVHEGPENATPQTPAIAIGPVLIKDRNDECGG